MDHYSKTYLGGRWVDVHGDQIATVVDPSTEECIASVRDSGPTEVDAAVGAATDCLPVLGGLSTDERAAHLDSLADELAADAPRLASRITSQMGAPVKMCREHQVDPAVGILRSYAESLRRLELTERIGASTVHLEPTGVVAAITPWNYPLLQAVGKFGAAFAAGCPVVLKPSEITPLDAIGLAAAAERAGLPAGSLNLALGTGSTVGEHLVRHRDVAMVSLTGSTRTGQRVAGIAGRAIKRSALELGGKSAAVVLPDGDLPAAVRHTVASVMLNTGQTCSALSRLLVPRGELDDAVSLVALHMSGYRLGSAHNPTSDVGPVASASHRQRVQECQERARIEGARVVWEGADDLPPIGYFVSPMAVLASDPRMSIAQQEVFGPVLTIIGYHDEDEAVQIANGTPYGLSAALWSRDGERAMTVSRRLTAGSVDVNGAPFNLAAPFGGYGQSGYGRELGAHGILEFTQAKSIQVPAS